MYEASAFRDEGMAKAIAGRFRLHQATPEPQTSAGTVAPKPGPIVSYTGGGHVQYHLPVPNRVLRRVEEPVKQTSIYLTAFDPARANEIGEYLRDGIADYVWLTPLSAHGVPRRCK